MAESKLPEFRLELDGPRPRAWIGGIQVHSRHRPGEEILAQCNAIPNSRSAIFVFGLGLGQHIPVIQKRWPGREIVFLEPHPAVWDRIASQGFADAGLSAPAAAPRPAAAPAPAAATAPASATGLRFVQLSPDASVLARQIEQLLPSDELIVPELISLPAYSSQFADLWQALLARQAKIREHRSINLATLSRFGKLWLRNSIRNLQIYSRAGSLNELVGSIAGAPAVLLAAGPSLDQVLPTLAKLAEHFIICAVDTALRPCIEAGVDPDFVLVVDPQYWNTRHLDRVRINPAKTRIITEISVHPGSLAHSGMEITLAASIFPLGEFIEEGMLTRLGAGGSVATSAWDLLRQAGASDILIAGMDLGFPGLQTHCAGSFSEELRHSHSSRTLSVESQACSYLFSGVPYTSKDYAASELVSDKRMDVYAAWFEQRFAEQTQMGEVRTWNLGLASRKLEGIQAISMEEALRRWTKPVARVREALPANKRIDASKLQERLELVRKELGKCLEQANLAIGIVKKTIDRLQNNPQARVEALLSELDKIDAVVLGLESRRIIGFLFEDLLHKIQTLPNPANLNESLERSLSMYEALRSSAAWLETELNGSRPPSSSGL